MFEESAGLGSARGHETLRREIHSSLETVFLFSQRDPLIQERRKKDGWIGLLTDSQTRMGG